VLHGDLGNRDPRWHWEVSLKVPWGPWLLPLTSSVLKALALWACIGRGSLEVLHTVIRVFLPLLGD
jgi:hypothetical protein